MLLGTFAANPRLTLGRFPSFITMKGDEARALGIVLTGNPDCTISVANLEIPLHGIAIDNQGDANEYLFGNTVRPDTLEIRIRVIGSACTVAIPEMPRDILRLHDIFLREGGQTLFWGCGTTAVGVSIELAGADASMLIGDDCMFSSGIWLRNFDMHTIFDTETGEILNSVTQRTIIERHVWFGADACLLGAERVGYGSIIGARSMVTQNIAPKSLAAGMPARSIRSNRSWTRQIGRVPAQTLNALRTLDSYE